MAVEPALHYVIVQKICDGEEAHPVVVGHPATHDFTTMKPGAAAGGMEVNSVIEAVRPPPSLIFHLTQVPQRR
jgi:hypothetical protein